MKIAVLVARILLGLMFLVFGLNGFLNFIPMPPIPGQAGAFLGVLIASHYTVVVSFIEVVAAVLLLSGQFIPLGLVLLGPVLFNILIFHVLMQPAGLPPGLLATILWFLVFFGVRKHFAGIFRAEGVDLRRDLLIPGLKIETWANL